RPAGAKYRVELRESGRGFVPSGDDRREAASGKGRCRRPENESRLRGLRHRLAKSVDRRLDLLPSLAEVLQVASDDARGAVVSNGDAEDFGCHLLPSRQKVEEPAFVC